MRDGDITSVLVGASKSAQILDNLKMMDNMNFSDDEIAEIEKILG
jgi:L-glyceraldehyde 3-phosphate reductase